MFRSTHRSSHFLRIKISVRRTKSALGNFIPFEFMCSAVIALTLSFVHSIFHLFPITLRQFSNFFSQCASRAVLPPKTRHNVIRPVHHFASSVIFKSSKVKSFRQPAINFIWIISELFAKKFSTNFIHFFQNENSGVPTDNYLLNE